MLADLHHDVQPSRSPRRWIAYVGPFGFPAGGAAARRILGNALAFADAGFDVVVASGYPVSPEAASSLPSGVASVSTGERDAEHLPRPLRRLRYAMMGRRTVEWLASRSEAPAAVILYSGYSPYLLRLLPWCRRQRIPLLFDAVEWYEASSPLAAALSPYQWNIELAMRWLVPRTDGVIAISSYLQRYLGAARVPTVRVPPTLDVRGTAARLSASSDGPLRLCYAGSPGTKDALDAMLRAVLDIDTRGDKLLFQVAGVPDAELRAFPALRRLAALPPSIRAVGAVAHGAAIDLVRQSDFSILLRQPTRVAAAGFPTKFVESFAVGTPVIANLTSDVGDHLRHGATGLVVADASPGALREALMEALATSVAERDRMRLACREHAGNAFDFRTYTSDLGAFVRRLAGMA